MQTANSKFGKILFFWKQILVVSFMLSAVFFIVSTVITPKYQATASILVLKKENNTTVFWQPDQANSLGQLVRNVLQSNSFQDRLLESNPRMKEIYKDSRQDVRLQQWQKDLKIRNLKQSGMLKIDYIGFSKVEARDLLAAIVDLLKKDGKNFYGTDQIEIRIVDRPYYLNQPAEPNLWRNTGVGAVLGFLVAILLIIAGKEKFFDPANLVSTVERQPLEPESGFFDKLVSTEKQAPEKIFDLKVKNESEEKKVEIVNNSMEKPQLPKQPEKKPIFESTMNKQPGMVPDNLPIFLEAEEEEEPKNTASAEKVDVADPISSQTEGETNNEEAFSEAEIKDRLNKLLKGEL